LRVTEFGSKKQFQIIRAKVAIDLSGEDGTLVMKENLTGTRSALFARAG